MIKGLLSRLQIFLYMKEKMYLKLSVMIFLFKMLQILSYSSSNFEFLNMHISLVNFSRHMCDVIGVNRSMKRESVKVLDQFIKSHNKQMNNHNRIINCTMVYREAIGHTNMHSKGCGRSFLEFIKDTVRRKAWTIFCKRKTFVLTKNHRLCSDHFTRE